MTNYINKIQKAVVLTSIIGGIAPASADNHEYEPADELSAEDVLPVDLLKGEHHTVEDRVRNNDYLKVRHHGPAAFFTFGY